MPLRRTNLLSYHKSVQFAAVLGYYALICLADRSILAPIFGYLGLFYRSPSTWTQIGVLGLILLCTVVTPVRYRQPSDGVLYMLLPLVVIPVLAVAATDVIFTNVAGDMMASTSGAYTACRNRHGSPATVELGWPSVTAAGMADSCVAVHISYVMSSRRSASNSNCFPSVMSTASGPYSTTKEAAR